MALRDRFGRLSKAQKIGVGVGAGALALGAGALAVRKLRKRFGRRRSRPSLSKKIKKLMFAKVDGRIMREKIKVVNFIK